VICGRTSVISGAVIAGFVLSVLVCQAGDRTCAPPQPAKDAKFHPGQVWQYKTRSGEERSLVTILKVESLPKGLIIHIRVDGVRLKNCSGGPEPETIEHMPFAREAIERSVTKLVREDPKIPDFQAGYDDWRNACGGVYTISIADAVKIDEITFNQNLGCQAQADK
jgi:hypothetical protein